MKRAEPAHAGHRAPNLRTRVDNLETAFAVLYRRMQTMNSKLRKVERRQNCDEGKSCIGFTQDD